MSIWDFLTQRGQDLLHQVATRLQFELPVEPAPAEWHNILARNVRLARGLNAANEDLLLRVARLLLDEVPFEACGGLVLDDEIRVTIAANAALLLYKLSYPRFTKLLRVLVYPDTFVPVRAESRHDPLITESKPTLGQAWINGMVVLSWADILHDAANHPHEGNVIIHEMAHILDAEDGRFDGTPLFDDSSQGAAWARILKRDFDRQRAAYDAGTDGPLNDYAATNRGEFFAVATEAFFCEPDRLRAQLPDLYDQMRQFFRQDHAAVPAGPDADEK
jgi:Mlc titration factor MtfA (ptsG expression regulator)